MKSLIKTKKQIEDMRVSGRILAEILQTIKAQTKAGMTTHDLAKIARAELDKNNVTGPFLGYHGYPDVICIALNNNVQHTIPSNVVIKDGDIVNLDFGVTFNGMITDAAITFGVGEISEDAKRLIQGTEEAVLAATKVIKDGVRVSEISRTIEKVLKYYNLGIVKELVGHGVGHELHEDPEIPNYLSGSSNFKLKSGMTICIEPIATLGSADVIFLDNGWDIITKDGSWAAQTEHTILVQPGGCEILTQCQN